MNTIWNWICKHPQRTAGIAQVAAGSLLTSLPSLGLNPRVLGALITLFGMVQAVFGFLKSQPPDPADIHDDGTAGQSQ